jgi:predicted negative regulator of RcsB-dependent stress response
LAWVAEHALEDEVKTVAHLRLAGLNLYAKKFDDALEELTSPRRPASRRWWRTGGVRCWPRAS